MMLVCVLCVGQAFMPAAFAQPANAAGPVVSVSTGQLRGSLNSDGGAVFKNIPFAQPPVGDLRWREPVPARPWTGVRDATAFGPMCLQGGSPNATKSEDCLQLNVWTPKWPMTSRVPVMVWIHGGGNFAGSAVEPSYPGDTLASYGVVVVSMNYRLGILGFFVHPDLTRESPHKASGNYGLMDQILALRWVQENVAKFGGDPTNVTIFGQSAGSADVNALTASPLTKGLFRRVIAQSGAASDQALRAAAEKRGVDWAATLGITGDQALAKLRAIPGEELLKSAGRGGGPRAPGAAPSGPSTAICVDGWVLPEQPTRTFAEGRQQKVALIIGNTSSEMGARGTTSNADLRATLKQRYGPLADRAIALYGVEGDNPLPPDPVNGTVAVQMSTDSTFRCGAMQELVWHTASGNPGYQFQFSVTQHTEGVQGAPHGSEVPFIMGSMPVWDHERHYTDTDRRFALMLQQYWTNFAKTGDPNGGNLPKWPKFDATRRPYMDFTDAGPIVKEGLRRPFCDLFMENQKRLMAQ